MTTIPIVDVEATGVRIRKLLDDANISIRELQDIMGFTTRNAMSAVNRQPGGAVSDTGCSDERDSGSEVFGMNVELLTVAIEKILQGRTGCVVKIYVTKNQDQEFAGCSVTEKAQTES